MNAPRIMVVEDERIVALNLRNVLTRLGYDTRGIVSSGEAALRHITSEPPDVVLMDIHIEGDIDGIDTAARIPPGLMVPVIYLTGISEDAIIQRARATNPYGFLLKPFSERELNATIQMALGRRAGDIALRNRVEELRLALTAAEFGAWEIDPGTGHILYKDHIGWSSDASPTTLAESFRGFLPTVHENDQDSVRAAFDRVSGNDSVCEVEFRKTTADGTERWFRVVGRAVSAPNDRRRRIVGVARDITGAKLAMREREASEQSYRNLISTINGIIWEVDLQTDTLTYVSESANRVLGYSAAEWLADPLFWEKHLHPEDAARTVAQYRRGAESGNSYESTYRMIAADGETAWVHEAVSTIVQSKQRAVLRGVMVDITSLKKAEQEIASTAVRLAESERRLAAILDTAAVGIVSVDQTLRISAFNLEAERIFGYSAGGMLGQRIDHLMPAQLMEPSWEPAVAAKVGAVKAGWRAITGMAADGRAVPLTVSVSEVQVAGMTTMTAIIRDMTEAQKAEEAMRVLMDDRERAVARGEAANRAKASFLAVMSHELRTPLNAIIGFSDAMSRELLGPIGNEAYRGYIEDIHHSGDLLLTIVNNILDLSRIESRKDDLKIEELALEDAWKPIASTMAADAAAKGVKLHFTPPKPGSHFTGDRNAVARILLNLVSNATKFTAAGGSVEVGLEDRGGDRLDIFVRDNGRGIPADQLPDITKPFVQVADSYVRDAGGVGLGLAICKALAAAMSGCLVIESEIDKGTTVRVVLPRAWATPEASAEPGRGDKVARSSQRPTAPKKKPARKPQAG